MARPTSEEKRELIHVYRNTKGIDRGGGGGGRYVVGRSRERFPSKLVKEIHPSNGGLKSRFSPALRNDRCSRAVRLDRMIRRNYFRWLD